MAWPRAALQVPPSFALLPEWLVEDLAEWLLYVTRMQPQLLAGQRLDELMLFMVVFMGSPGYIRNPYLRSKLSEVVHAWLPRDTPGTSFVSRCAEGRPVCVTSTLCCAVHACVAQASAAAPTISLSPLRPLSFNTHHTVIVPVSHPPRAGVRLPWTRRWRRCSAPTRWCWATWCRRCCSCTPTWSTPTAPTSSTRNSRCGRCVHLPW